MHMCYHYPYITIYMCTLRIYIDLQLSNFMTPATCFPPKKSQHPFAIWHKECDQSCGLAEQIQERSVSCQAIYGGELLMLGQLGWAAKAQGPRPKVFRLCGYSVATGRSWWSRKISMNQQSCEAMWIDGIIMHSYCNTVIQQGRSSFKDQVNLNITKHDDGVTPGWWFDHI